MAGRPELRDAGWIVGKLLEHGAAPYQFEEGQSASYFAKLKTRDEGEERVLWGADLKRAIERSRSNIKTGQLVAVRMVGREPVTSSRSGEKLAGRYRNLWEAETPTFVAQRAATAKKILADPVQARRSGETHPELAGLYLALRGAELIAKTRYADPGEQERFVTRIREALAPAKEREGPPARAGRALGQE